MGTSSELRTVLIAGKKVSLTSLSKPIWEKQGIDKAHYLSYLIAISPYLLPFLKNRVLTVIRYPHGVSGDAFFQKHCPEYAPDFIKGKSPGARLVCPDLPSLIWLGNQLALEFHIPFQTIGNRTPSEIVFDLDPPSRDDFPLAVKASLMIKTILDQLHLTAFIKTSGNKGLQIFLPLPDGVFTYQDTRLFMTFVADVLLEKEPALFTTERLKKNRGKRLYLDVVQHSEGKTIIAPYSARGNPEALVSTPLFWDEVNEDLRPEKFPINAIVNRVKQKGCPFADFFRFKQTQPLSPVLAGLKKQNKPNRTGLHQQLPGIKK